MQQHVYAISQACQSAGIQQAIICPGSRSAPLVFAFTQSKICCHSIVDERSAGYIALGMAQQLQQPVVLICTSGTAALNFFSAIAEAFYQKIPLIVLTADRPQELLNQQDGQMIMQQGVFGEHVRASYELPCYEVGGEELNATFSLVSKAIQHAVSQQGPIHINVPLKEPLYPSKINNTTSFPQKNIITKPVPKALNDSVKNSIITAWKKAQRKLILIGQLPLDGAINGALTALAKRDDVVIICDVLSNQYGFNTAPQFDYLITRADAKTAETMQPDFILSAGGPVLSKALKAWLQKQQPQHHFRINTTSTQIDTYRNVTQQLETDITAVLLLLAHIPSQQIELYKPFWEAANSFAAKGIKQFLSTKKWSELQAMNYVLQHIPDISNVQVGNSSIIRYVSYLGALHPSWKMDGNRGTSGIDGCTSTAVGAAMVNNRPTFLLTGDIAFLYDYNALWNKLPHNLKIIVFNNEGGGIFQLIEGPAKHADQLHFFTTPHQQSIQQIALQKGLRYYFCDDLNSLQKVAHFFNPSSPSALLEIKSNIKTNSSLFKLFKGVKL
jgi:2-succinyl-5-enolpyruvyl-6-hydroxy-3-cyclohexene-1-carboxylate synthase